MVGKWVSIPEAAKYFGRSQDVFRVLYYRDKKTGRTDRFIEENGKTRVNIPYFTELYGQGEELQNLFYKVYEIYGSDRKIGKVLVEYGVPLLGKVRPLQRLKCLLPRKYVRANTIEKRKYFIAVLKDIIKNACKA